MKRDMFVFVPLMMCFIMAAVFPLAANEPQVLTIHQAIDKALKGNPDLLQSQNMVKLASFTLRQSRANLLPTLSFSTQGSRQYAKSQDGISGNSTALSFSLGADLNLFNGFGDKAAIEGSRLAQQMAQKELSRSQQTILFNTTQGYLLTVVSQEFIAVEEENLKAQQIQLQMIDDFVGAGKRPKADLYQQQAQIAGSELRLLEARRTDHYKKLQLMQILGETPRADYEVVDPGIDRLMTQLERLNLEAAARDAQNNRPDLLAKEIDVKAAETDIQAASAGYWPKLSLFSDIGGSYNNVRSSNSWSSQLFDHNLSGAIGMSLSVPIFDRFKTANAVASARIQKQSSQLQWEKTRIQVDLDVQQAQEEFRSAQKEIQVSDSQLTYSRQALESIEARYKVQAATMAELIQARAVMVDARYTLVQTRFNLIIRAMALAYACGDDRMMNTLIKTDEGE